MQRMNGMLLTLKMLEMKQQLRNATTSPMDSFQLPNFSSTLNNFQLNEKKKMVY